MICTACGKALQNDARFCAYCGSETSQTCAHPSGAFSNPTSTPIATAKAKSIPRMSLFSVSPLQIFLTLWAAFFFGGLATIGSDVTAADYPKWLPFVLPAAVVFVAVPALTRIHQKVRDIQKRF